MIFFNDYYFRTDLDELGADYQSTFGDEFTVLLNLKVADKERKLAKNLPWHELTLTARNPLILFYTKDEFININSTGNLYENLQNLFWSLLI